jgi:hypothetical protein
MHNQVQYFLVLLELWLYFLPFRAWELSVFLCRNRKLILQSDKWTECHSIGASWKEKILIMCSYFSNLTLELLSVSWFAICVLVAYFICNQVVD